MSKTPAYAQPAQIVDVRADLLLGLVDKAVRFNGTDNPKDGFGHPIHFDTLLSAQMLDNGRDKVVRLVVGSSGPVSRALL